MQRLFNISKWSHVSSGKAIEFAGDRPRKVVLETNSPGKSILSILERGSNRFLAVVEGRDSVEFYVTGPFWIAATGADCYIYTADGDGVSYKSLDAESFTVIRERRQRNPELEYMLRMVSENMSKRLHQQAVELERAFSRRVGAVAAQSAPETVPSADVSASDDPGDDPATGGDDAPVRSGDDRPRGRPARGGAARA